MDEPTTDLVMELVSGYEAYAEVAEMHMEAAVDAPASSVPCVIASAIVSATAARGC